ncbi:hypothetical protein EYR40_004651 [Pleurotus pulmonarius]|nr:hypothetical protein EYR38_001894 [Pleurotus pulmonarius]KAF4605860.1 hypothetical protein EYR40_004651 [Pleurotus pulmonarius]
MPITALHIQSSLSYDVHWLFRILRAGGATIKTLKLEDIDFRVKLSRQATPSGGKILMSALQELSLIDCCNIPFRRSTVDMPNLKTFVCESYGYPDYHSILPTSLTTLVVEPLLEECDRTQTIVDNLCLLCLLEEDIDWIEATIDSVSVPTKIVHLEICLPEMSPSHPLVNPSNDLEVLVLRLYRDGSLKKLTVTVEQLTDPDILTRRFKELLRLGILEVRVEKQPLLHPSPYTFHIN